MAPRRIPFSYIALSTVAAFLAASVVLMALGADPVSTEGSGDAETDDVQADLIAVPNLPSSVPEVELVALDGGPDRRLGELLDGRPLVVNIFASWCGPCVAEMPELEQVHQDLGDEVAVLGLANRDRPERAQEIVEGTGVTYPTFSDPDASAFTFFGGLNMPTTVFLAPDGEVIEVLSRSLTEEDLRDRIADHFGVGVTR